MSSSSSSASSHASGSSADPIIGKAALRQRPPEVTWQPGSRTVLVAVHLPTATSSAGLQLELVTDTELHLSGASFGAVRIALPTAVLDEGTSAKFEKRSRVLRVRLPVAGAVLTAEALSRQKHAASGRKWKMLDKNKRRRGHGSAARRKGRRKHLQKKAA